ncbi:MAG TPA: Cys-Gln thioester bond-forming surface protein [Candidatus Onthousia excrementipullorum]|uniref:Cys-Gln thioester bond-forming surface protein n=1 Tax=Candidatus Onthousia excrementipullorum TaxID=2840884 RepID=A0A9D1DTN4_9FIRM|nr:Cys-Gln thioester bond-forming surface protein [Candidatus Onthousia excrementipullorum]
MKKLKMHKFKLMILAVLIATLGIFTLTGANAASSAPTTFTADSEKLLEGYIDNWHYGKLTSSLGGYVYCRDFNLGIPYGVTMTLEGEAPAPIAYILSNGFPRTSITGNDDMDYYITQAALWWYMDLHMGTHNLPDQFKTTGSDPHNLRQYIIKLVKGAEGVTSYATPAISLVNNDTSLNLSSDKKYYESNAISVKTLYTTGNYTISLSGAPSGTTVVNASTGAAQTSFATNESFKVRIPVDSVDVGNLNITVKATATGSINKAYMYKSSDPTKQSVFGSVLYPDTSTVTDQTILTLSTSKVTITKIDDATNKPLAGATFVVKDSAGKTVATWTSTTSSHVIKNLPNGTYTLQETKAPAGYILNDQVVKFTISDTNRNISIRFRNDEINKEATIIKVDAETGKAVAGAVLVVKDANGKVVEEFTTTTSAHVLKDLADGTYTVEEKTAPKGYEKTNEVFKFTISDTNNKAEITIKNKLIEKTAEIIKIDSVTKKPVAGAVLVVKDSTGKVVEEFTTTTKSHILENLADGTYTVEEKTAPKGYEKTDKVYNFTISDTNNKAEITIENKAIEKLVTIFKVDGKTGNPIYGAVLIIRDSDGNIVDEFTSTEEGHTLTGLKDGKYTVEEKQAPEGYTKSDEIYTFTISDETPTALVFFENNEIVEVPFTGSSKSLISTLFGSVLLISGVGFVYYNGKKQKVK